MAKERKGLSPRQHDPVWYAVAHPKPEEPEELPSWGSERVYFLHFHPNRRVKIGYTKNLAKRRADIQREVGYPGVLLGCLNGGRNLERLMHQRFAEHRIRGEWFSDTIIEEAETLIRADRDFYGLAA